MKLFQIKIKRRRFPRLRWKLFYSLPPPNEPNMANRAKNRATGRIPMTVKAMFLAFSHSAFPVPTGHAIASLTSEKIKIPISRATAAPINDKMNPKLNTMIDFNR